MERFLKKAAFLVIAAAVSSGCASVISKGVLQDVDRTVTVDAVRNAPEFYAGKKVVWGGTILSSENLEKTTVIEVLETSLLYDDTPSDVLDTRGSKGRFLIEAAGYLDTAVFKSGTKITVAGIIKGTDARKIGKMDYLCPVLAPLEVKLFEPSAKAIPIYDPWRRSPYPPFHPYHPLQPAYPYYPYPY